MVLLKHGEFEFKNILRSGYKISEDTPSIISTVTMADGSEKTRYGEMPKTTIKVKFSRLDKNTYKEYISHFLKNEDVYSYFSLRQQKMITKKFRITLPEISVLSIKDNHNYDEFEVQLTQCGEV